MKKLLAATLAWFLAAIQLSNAAPGVAAHTQASCAAGTVIATAGALANGIWYISGILVDTIGATTAGSGSVTLAGLLGSPSGTLTFPLSWTGVGAGAGTMINIQFPQPLSAAGVNTAVVLTIPNMGAGATNCSATIFGELR